MPNHLLLTKVLGPLGGLVPGCAGCKRPFPEHASWCSGSIKAAPLPETSHGKTESSRLVAEERLNTTAAELHRITGEALARASAHSVHLFDGAHRRVACGERVATFSTILFSEVTCRRCLLIISGPSAEAVAGPPPINLPRLWKWQRSGVTRGLWFANRAFDTALCLPARDNDPNGPGAVAFVGDDRFHGDSVLSAIAKADLSIALDPRSFAPLTGVPGWLKVGRSFRRDDAIGDRCARTGVWRSGVAGGWRVSSSHPTVVNSSITGETHVYPTPRDAMLAVDAVLSHGQVSETP